MIILSFDSAATAASVALYEDGVLLAENYQRTGLTHSRTLLPMAQYMLKNCDLNMSCIDALAVAAGPGSFTGLRIGISLIKGLAMADSLPCIGVSTLEAMAAAATQRDALLCAVMDARAGQVYNAIFDLAQPYPVRLCEDRAIHVEDLLKELEKTNKEVIITGDGTHLLPQDYMRFPDNLRFGHAYGVARAAEKMYIQTPAEERNSVFSAEKLIPSYHRLPQAERERIKNLQKES